MKRSLLITGVLVIVVVIGVLVLMMQRSVGSGATMLDLSPTPMSEVVLEPSLLPTISATLTYSDYLALTSGDIWEVTPPPYPLNPTPTWPIVPKPTYPMPTLNPTPTHLPDMGVRMSTKTELAVRSVTTSQFAALSRIISLDVDGQVLAGLGKTETDTYVVIAIHLVSGELQVLFEAQEQLQGPSISGDYVVWTTLNSLYIYNLSNGQLDQKEVDTARFARISGNIVVWQGAGDIEGYNLRTKEGFSVANNPDVLESLPLISGEWVVYLTPTESFSAAHLWVVNIHTQEHIYITELPLWYRAEEYLNSLYAIDMTWLTWASESALNLYDLNSGTSYHIPVESCVYTFTTPNSGTLIGRRKPSHLAIAENTIIFSCGQWMGYDIEREVFFSLPIHDAEMTTSGFDGWAIFGDKLVWILTEDAFGPQERSHIFTARIERNP